MSLFDRVRGLFGAENRAPPEVVPAAEADARAEEAALAEKKKAEKKPYERLARIGLPEGPSVEEAIALLRQARGGVDEADAVTFALSGLGQRALPEPIRVACADILAARGDEQGAQRVLEGTRSIAGLVLSADLFAGSGQLARAVGAIERVLARDIAAPGARERHERWSLALGYGRGPAKRLDEATVVAPQAKSGPFRLLREIARGGAGAVYEAEDDVLGRRIAFKVYHGRGHDRSQLLREVRTALAVGGGGVLRIFDADPDDGWISLEWVPRGSVRDMLKKGDVEPLAAVERWARPLARALARVHARGFVHADVKPANVFFRRDLDVVLGDFGIARPIGAPGDGGSPGYISPERLAGRDSSPRDDIYGYGRILEDVIHRLEEGGRPHDDADPWLALALACIGPDDARPADGAELLTRLP